MSTTKDEDIPNPFATPAQSIRAPSLSGTQPQTPDGSTNPSNSSSSLGVASTPPQFPSPNSFQLRLPNVSRRRTRIGPQKRMKSHLLSASHGCEPGQVPKPWREKPEPRQHVSYWMVYALILVGLGLGVFQCIMTYFHVRLDREPLCLIFDEEFDGSENDVFGEGGTFTREVKMDGFGNGQFEMTTASSKNSYIKDGMLYIVPTLTEEEIGHDAVFGDATYNITGCTFNETARDNGYIIGETGFLEFDYAGYARACSAVSNTTSRSIINPVQSARLTTRKTVGGSLRYGKVEIRAKMPAGDWMWPALWMLPKDEVYGDWPRSGEIDIVESRGNGLRYTARGRNYVQGSLNWGPAPELNSVSKSYSWWSEKRKGFNEDFHTYTLEWTNKFIRISVDTRLHTLLDFKFNKPFFERGEYPTVFYNRTAGSLGPLINPWQASNETNVAPFDQEFFLILNVAVGATTGWFPEGQGDKPWLNGGEHAMRDFAEAKDQWYPTWPQNPEDRGMVVDYVRMWKHC